MSLSVSASCSVFLPLRVVSNTERWLPQVFANDLDQGQNGQVSYSLRSSSMSSLFKIDPATGSVSTAAIMDREIWTHTKWDSCGLCLSGVCGVAEWIQECLAHIFVQPYTPETFLCHVSFLSLKESKWVISSSVEGSEKKMVCPWAFSLQLCHPVMGEVRGQSSEVRRIPRSCDVGQINNYVSIYFLIFFAIFNFFIWKHYTIGAKDKSLIQLILETFASLLWRLLFSLLL